MEPSTDLGDFSYHFGKQLIAGTFVKDWHALSWSRTSQDIRLDTKEQESGICISLGPNRPSRANSTKEVSCMPPNELKVGEFQASTTLDKDQDNAFRIEFRHEGQPLCWERALQEMENPNNSNLRELLNLVLRDVRLFESFFWECAPVSSNNRGSDRFEFTVVDAPTLANTIADDEPFSEHISKGKGKPVVEVFENSGRDATLVAPTNATGCAADYAHLATFIRGTNVPQEQRDAAWRQLAQLVSKRLDEHSAVWVSTDGRGVAWLHLRVETRPKYYKTNRYLKVQESASGYP